MAGKGAMLPTLFIASAFAFLMFASGSGAVEVDEGVHGVLVQHDIQEIVNAFANLITTIIQGSPEYAYGTMFVANLVTTSLGDRVTIRCLIYGSGNGPAQCNPGPGGPGRIVTTPADVVGRGLATILRVATPLMVEYGATYFTAVAEHFAIQYYMDDYEADLPLRFGNESLARAVPKDAGDCWVYGSTLMSGYRDMPHQSLYSGQSLFSPNGRYKLTMQYDCNLVQYSGLQPVWATGTSRDDSDCTLRMQLDGNLVVYSGSEERIWATDRYCEPEPLCQEPTIFTVQDDCDMVVYRSGSPMKLVWNSKPTSNCKT